MNKKSLICSAHLVEFPSKLCPFPFPGMPLWLTFDTLRGKCIGSTMVATPCEHDKKGAIFVGRVTAEQQGHIIPEEIANPNTRIVITCIHGTVSGSEPTSDAEWATFYSYYRFLVGTANEYNFFNRSDRFNIKGVQIILSDYLLGCKNKIKQDGFGTNDDINLFKAKWENGRLMEPSGKISRAPNTIYFVTGVDHISIT